jgi:hypothetical protein
MKSHAPFVSAAVLMGVLLASTSPAHAERINTLAELKGDSLFMAYVQSPETRQRLKDIATKWDAELGQACKEPYVIDPMRDGLSVLRPIETTEAGQPPVEGVWRIQFTAQRCGGERSFSVLGIAVPGKPVHHVNLLPGKSITDFSLMRDTLNAVVPSYKGMVQAQQGKTCSDFAITDTQVTTPPASTDVPSRFEEAWTLRYCGEVKTFPICYAPREAGGMSFHTVSCAEAERRGLIKAAASGATPAGAAAPAASGVAASAAAVPAAPAAPAASASALQP